MNRRYRGHVVLEVWTSRVPKDLGLSLITRLRPSPELEPATVTDQAEAGAATRPRRGRGRIRRVLATVATALAAVLVFVALVAPDQHTRLTSGVFVRIPVEGLIGAALLLVLPPRARRIAAVLIGGFLGLLVLVQVLDFGFWTFLNRQFDLIADWGLLDDGVNFLRDAVGRAGSIAAIVLAAV